MTQPQDRQRGDCEVCGGCGIYLGALCQFCPVNSPWRVGRKVGRTIYAQTGDQPSDDDPLIGVMDTRQLAAAVVADHNRAAARVRQVGQQQ